MLYEQPMLVKLKIHDDEQSTEAASYVDIPVDLETGVCDKIGCGYIARP